MISMLCNTREVNELTLCTTNFNTKVANCAYFTTRANYPKI